MGTWVASTFWLLGTMLLRTLECKYLFKSLLSLLLVIYPDVELLDHVISLCLTFWGICIPFLLWKILNIHERSKKRAINTHMLTSQIANEVSDCLALERHLVRDVLHSLGLRASDPCCPVLAISPPAPSDTNFQVFFPWEKIYNSVLLMDQGTCRDPQCKFNKC